MSDIDDVLAANRDFYRAFADGDLEAMDRLWAREAPVACIHPGWAAVEGRDRVLASWAGILGGPRRPRVAHRREQALLYGEVALVLCEEVIGEGVLAATNAFVREGAAWRMVHHQATPVAPAAARPPPPGARTLH